MMNDLDAGSARLVYADPPFGTGRNFTTYDDCTPEQFDDLIASLLEASARVLCPGGSLWLHLSQAASMRAWRLIEARDRARIHSRIAWERIHAPKAKAGGIAGVLDEILVIDFDGAFAAARLRTGRAQANLHRSWDGDPVRWISGDYSAPRADLTPVSYTHLTLPTNREV